MTEGSNRCHRLLETVIQHAERPHYNTFNSHPRPSCPNSASMTVSSPIEAAACRLTSRTLLFRDRLLANYSGYVLVAHGVEMSMWTLRHAVPGSRSFNYSCRRNSHSQNNLKSEQQGLEGKIKEAEVQGRCIVLSGISNSLWLTPHTHFHVAQGRVVRRFPRSLTGPANGLRSRHLVCYMPPVGVDDKSCALLAQCAEPAKSTTQRLFECTMYTDESAFATPMFSFNAPSKKQLKSQNKQMAQFPS